MRYYCLACLLSVAFVTTCSGRDNVLVREGRTAFSIYCGEDMPSSVKRAANELRDYLRKTTGVELPTVKGPTQPMICLGDCAASREAGLSLEDIPAEGFRIAARNGDIYILGPDTPDGKRTPRGGRSTGTLFGVYTFLEKFVGVRWLVPGPGGEYVPKTSTLVVPAVDLTDAPDFQRRRLPYIQERRPEVKRWLARNKLGESIYLHHGHNWRSSIPASLYDEHPDYFAMRNGKRVPPAGRYKLCTTNPNLIRAYADSAIAAFNADPGRFCYSLSPSDSAGWCECNACTAFDETDPNGKLSITRRILAFYNEVAKLVAERQPDRIVCGYIYSSYVFPPKDRAMKLEPNLFLVWAPSFDYGFTLFRPQLRAQWDRALDEWTAMTDNIGYYDLCVNLLQEAGAPNPPGVKILKHIFPRLKKHGIKSLYLYGVSAWGHAGLLNYLLAKLMWDADADVDALFDEFCERAYGNGADEMKQIYRMLDEAMERHYRKDLSARYKMTQAILKQVYAVNFPRIESLHQKALAKAVNGGVRARLNMFGDNLKVLCWYLNQHKLLPNGRDSAYYLPMAELNAFMADRSGSLALKESVRNVKRRRVPRLDVEVAGRAPNAAPVARYGLRGNMDLVICSPSDGPIELTFTRLIARGQLVRFKLVDSKGEPLLVGVAEEGGKIKFDAEAGHYYVLGMHAGSGTFAISATAPTAVDARSSERGLHFQSGGTPVYFHVSEGTRSFGLTLASDAPGETAVAKVYDPSNKLVATLKTVETPVDRRVIDVNEGGIWKVAVEAAETGAFDDAYIEPGAELSGFFSLSGDAVLRIKRLKPK